MGQYSENQNTNFDSGQHIMVTLAAGLQFKASKWKEFCWGKHWRDEWLKPVNFPIFKY
jgi:hypothetical protein